MASCEEILKESLEKECKIDCEEATELSDKQAICMIVLGMAGSGKTTFVKVNNY